MPEPQVSTAASLAWTSDSSSLIEWRRHVARGEFAKAEATVAEDRSPAADEARELLRRLRYEWSLTADAMLEKLVAQIPDVTREELDAWTTSGAIESMTIDGELRYFRREPRNLLLFKADVRARQERAANAPPTADRHDSTSPIIPHLEDVIRAADASPTARELLPVRTRFHYTLTVKPNRPVAKVASLIRAWLPFPQNYRQQRDVRLISCSPVDYLVAPEGSPHRTIYFEQRIIEPIIEPAQSITFKASYEYTTRAIRGTGFQSVTPEDTGWKPVPQELEERPPHILFTYEVRAIVRELSSDSPDQRTLAKRLWNWVDDHIPWRAEHEYGLIPSIIEQSLRLRRGDCGVSALTLITLCRCAGIPARWQSGWTTDPMTGGNMHDWTELFLDGDWIPVDPSYGKKAHADERVRDFYFGGLDRYRLIVNTDFGQPLVPAKTSLRSEPLDFQRGEVEIDGRNLYFDEWDYAFSFEHAEASGPISPVPGGEG